MRHPPAYAEFTHPRCGEEASRHRWWCSGASAATRVVVSGRKRNGRLTRRYARRVRAVGTIEMKSQRLAVGGEGGRRVRRAVWQAFRAERARLPPRAKGGEVPPGSVRAAGRYNARVSQNASWRPPCPVFSVGRLVVPSVGRYGGAPRIVEAQRPIAPNRRGGRTYVGGGVSYRAQRWIWR